MALMIERAAERRITQAAWRAVDPGEISRLPVERRVLIAAGEIGDDLTLGLSKLQSVYARAALAETGSLRAELRRNVVECRRLILLLSMVRDIAGETSQPLADVAQEIAQQADLALADPEFCGLAGQEVAEGARRAWAGRPS